MAGMTWLTLLATAAVVAINVAGLWEMPRQRASLVEGARRMLGLGRPRRRRILEARLASDARRLRLMAGSPVFFDLKSVLASRDPARWRAGGGWRRKGPVLLFLRARRVMRAVVRDDAGQPLIRRARRGGRAGSLDVGGRLAGAGAPRARPGCLQPIEGRFEPRLGTRTVQGARGD